MTPYGKAAVSWMTAAGKLDLEVTVPVGASAVVDLPDHEPVELGAGTHHLTMAL
ncbi:alpha-L-rhamnosidase C-terminal domain-containing protein [uncultured Bifidobacterium sp.]|uniref:alpha-L-rhamnosidase C-terminal domain-containing protein n=1 Tax=uncultured Bifidobacterium sp. TaxID=165187 RepID=UPI00259093E3|nr:alpha-L-rhamnosidase C-terminal domain-containing protein [uncultured Bifidobacterium sp.]